MMTWISKYPPIYVWEADKWYSEKDRNLYSPNLSLRVWETENMPSVPFQNKTVIMDQREKKQY